jgi:hypothetical protein
LAYGKDLKGGTVPGLALVPGIIAFAGGLPVMTDDKVHIGGIGVSGGTADQDETCAQAGIDFVQSLRVLISRDDDVVWSGRENEFVVIAPK